LRNGDLCDCSGCPYKMCLHFGEKGSCFYGGVIVDDVYPAVKKANAILMLCPNYNDSLSANLTAFINRLTALFRTTRFYDKALFAIVVSGYSGSDIVAKQLISALNMNKTFYLPGHFAVMETANNPGTAVNLPGIEERISRFKEDIRKTLKREG
ncbi:MAG: NAD(P)H-dependent oxidoreductase, partial [Clostridium sp.]